MTDTEPTVPAVPPDGEGAGAGPRNRLMKRRVASLVAAIALIVAAVVVPTAIAVHQAGNYFVFSPGTAPLVTTNPKCASAYGQLQLPDGEPCVRLAVPADKAHKFDGKVFMVDVEVGQASPLQWVKWQLGLLGASDEMVPLDEYAGLTPTAELGCQDTQDMLSANQDAALAALAVLHYKVVERPLGAQLYTVFAGSPAWDAGLKCDDLLTAVDGKKVLTAKALTAQLSALPPGTEVTVTDRPGGGGAPRTVRLKMAPVPATVAQGFAGRSYMGVEVETRYNPQLPFAISVNAGAIGGPSAGLAFTLAILDCLSNGDLTGGHRVAATGVIAPGGAVGAIGGIKEKTVAVENAGAQVFFVPSSDYAGAKAVADKSLAVIPVTKLSQALEILRTRYGGEVPTALSTKTA